MDINLEENKNKIIKWLKGGFELYKENFVLIFLATAATIALSFITALILGGPLLVGLFLILFRLIDKSEPAPVIQDLSKGFDFFLPALFFALSWVFIYYIGASITGAIPGIGGTLSFIFSSALTAVTMFGIPLIADKKLDFIKAYKKSIETIRPEIILYLLFSLTISIISTAGILLFIIGMFFTVPFNMCAIAVAYKDVFGIENKSTEEKTEKKKAEQPEEKKEE